MFKTIMGKILIIKKNILLAPGCALKVYKHLNNCFMISKEH